MKTVKKILEATLFMSALFLTPPAGAFEYKTGASNALQVGAAVYIQGMMHELGHNVIAYQLEATSSKMEFFTNKNGNFFLGLNTASGIKEDSWVSYRMGGFVFSNITFEIALSSYRKNPTLFSKTLAIMSATDFFRYSAFAFGLGHDDVEEYDPAYVSKKSGFSKEALLLGSLTQALVNVYRLYSENDAVIPFIEFSGDHINNSVLFGFRIKL
ncbi:MAG: hypothetical protein ACE5FU_08420 [Nitrospinota bacterium]